MISNILNWIWARLKKYKIVAIIVAIAIGAIYIIPIVGALFALLTPPDLRPVQISENREWLSQNWEPAEFERFHHESQGTTTLPVPVDWLVALEQPMSSPLSLLIPFASKDLFVDAGYMSRFGFLQSRDSDYNPYNLPIGFATTDFQNFPGLGQQKTAIGFTCAACHTGSLSYDNVEYIIEGGPSRVDLGVFQQALGVALAQTAITAQLPTPNRRFTRFAKRVLGQEYSATTRKQLSEDMASLLGKVATGIEDIVEVTEGYGRLDALNRIGNQIFAKDYNREKNNAPINAPVNYPHIWTVPWFKWVQYDGSIMQPAIRNAGEALGVSAAVNLTAPPGQGRFSSSIPMKNLKWMEDTISGAAPYPNKQFSGLSGPEWPDSFPAIDANLANEGAQLYRRYCLGCHLPAIDTPEFWTEKVFKPIVYYNNKGERQQTAESFIDLNIIPLNRIGTDPAQSDILAKRTVDISTNSDNQGLDLDTYICIPEPALVGSAKNAADSKYKDTTSAYDRKEPRLIAVKVTDAPMTKYAFALGAIVQETNDQWFKNNFTPDSERTYFEGQQPNCLQAGAGYKARPLNGIWATAPFLHNGSVPTLDAMLRPQEERPKYVVLGPSEFDPVKVGLMQPDDVSPSPDGYRDGNFIVDTTIPGNLNIGHEFTDRRGRGAIGPKLSDDQRKALIEYLKTL